MVEWLVSKLVKAGASKERHVTLQQGGGTVETEGDGDVEGGPI